MNILDFITEENIIYTFNKLINTPNDLKLLLQRLKDNDNKEALTKYTFFVVNEDISINSNLNIIKTENYNNLYNDYLNGKINLKTKKIIDYIPNVFVNTDEKIAYKDIDNLNNEVIKILKLHKFINDDGDLIFLKSKNASEYLNINGQPANMLGEDIEFYSSLLNYTKNEIENSKGLKAILGDIYSNNKENWDKYHEYFQKFLEDLKKRTINY